ncbi:MAG: AEC family transporter [Acetobacteraceae bacterium]|nr:AEC family transporter [Acetobacteraceae bacterium]
MGALIEVVLPVFALIGLGRFAAWRRLLPERGGDALTGYIFLFALPALLFRSVAGSGGISFAPALPFMAIALGMFGLGVVLSRRLLGDDLANAGVFGLNCAFGNTVMMGVPVIEAAFGRAGVRELLAIIAFHSAVLFPIATATVEAGLNTRLSARRLLRATAISLARNPIIDAIALGFLWTLVGLPLPAPVARLLDLLAASATPVALFCLGLGLPAVPGRTDLAPALLSSLVKNLLMPALMYLATRAVGLPPLGVAVATVTAAMPTGANAFMIAARYATGAERSAAAVLLSTAASLVVLGLLLVAFGQA